MNVGFTQKILEKLKKRQKEKENEGKNVGGAAGAKNYTPLAPIGALKYSIADTLEDLMPEVSIAPGIEVDEDMPLRCFLITGDSDDKIDNYGNTFIKRELGFCPFELENDFSEQAFGLLLMFRLDIHSLGNARGRVDNTS